jgi:ribosomal protein S19E (S16A)
MLHEESGISPEVAAERGYRTIRNRDELPAAFKPYQRRRGLLVPMHSPDGETVCHQLRPDKPRKDGPKYETPAGSSPVVDVHPRMLEEVRHGDGLLLITEGGKTGDAATSHGIPTVVLPGVWMWCVPGVRPYRLKPCFDHVRLEGRDVLVAFDSDCMSKAGVQEALAALVAALEDRGASVKVIYLPDAPDGSKQGVDDFLVAGGTIREMFMLARKFDPADVGRIRLSRDEKLRAAVEDLDRGFWEFEWKGMGGHSARDVYLKLIEAARRRGVVVSDGVRVEQAQGPLFVQAKVSSRTGWKVLNRLEEWGLIYRDNEGRTGKQSGAFVLRANVSQYGEGPGREGKATQELRGYDPCDLHLRAPRLRWSQPKFTPKRGTVADTRMVRQGPKPEPRDRIERLGKIRGAILDALDKNGGAMHINELADALHRKRARDIRRRNLPMLEEAGIVAVDCDTVTLSDNWLEALEEQRKLSKEIEAEKTAREWYRAKSKGYRDWLALPPEERKALKEQRARARADGFIGDLRPAGEPEEHQPEPEVSDLAVAIRDYLDRKPHDACQPPGWIGSTLWAFDLYPSNPTPTEARAAIDELGGEAYLRDHLERARRVAA